MRNLPPWVGLIKFRLSLAVTFSAFTGFLLYRNTPGLDLLFMSGGVFLLASGAAALNQFSEKGPDSRMVRTKHRPIPDERITPRKALIFSFVLLVSGSVILVQTGVMPLILGIITVLLYNIVYTSLKRISWLAIIPGALVGAIPPVIGFTAAGGTTPSADILLFSFFMFLWQLPHFWLIILRYRNDYKTAGFKTLPEQIDDRVTRILVFSWVAVTSVLLAIFSVRELVFNPIITLILIPVNFFFILIFYRVLFSAEKENSVRTAFILINSFSLIVMILFIINSFLLK